MPGPKPWVGGGNSTAQPATEEVSPAQPAPAQSTTATSATPKPTAAKPSTMSTVAKPAATPPTAAGTVPLYGQCGGEGYSGATECATGTCESCNPYYHQCQN